MIALLHQLPRRAWRNHDEDLFQRARLNDTPGDGVMVVFNGSSASREPRAPAVLMAPEMRDATEP